MASVLNEWSRASSRSLRHHPHSGCGYYLLRAGYRELCLQRCCFLAKNLLLLSSWVCLWNRYRLDFWRIYCSCSASSARGGRRADGSPQPLRQLSSAACRMRCPSSVMLTLCECLRDFCGYFPSHLPGSRSYLSPAFLCR